MNTFEKIIDSLKISETMFINATEKYEAVAKLLSEKIGGARVYTQGSFAIGTTTRPYKAGKELSYDIDLILEVERDKSKLDGNELLKEVYNILNENGLYNDKLELGEKSITIKYADVEGIGFNLDIVPSVKESYDVKNELIKIGANEDYVKDAIAISSLDKKDKNGWYTALPKGYRKWFEEINLPYKKYLFETVKRDKNGKTIYNSIEEVPHYKLKTAVQEVIQILKRIRDIYYSKIDKFDKKPISAILTTIVAKIASRNDNYNVSTLELLKKVVEELKIYNMYNSLTAENFCKTYPSSVDIKKEKDEWKMVNPVNPLDNLVDSWNKDEEISNLFFNWLDIIDKEIAKMLSEACDKSVYENLFGYEFIRKVLGIEAKENSTKGPKPYGEC